MASTGFVRRLLGSCAAAAFMAVVAACGGDGGGAPPPPQPVSLAISGLPTSPMQLGRSAQLTATLTYPDSSTRDVTATATWTTSNSAVLTVSAAGVIQAAGPGQAEVAVSTQGLGARGSVTVSPPAPQLAPFAGDLGGPGNSDGTGAQGRFGSPNGVATDTSGNVYVADGTNHTIRRIGLTGVVSTLAGKAGSSGRADGIGAEARLSYPWGVATDRAGNVYVSDNTVLIRKITPDGAASTLAGGFGTAMGVATDSAGNVYVAEYGSHVISKITPSGVVSTLAGTIGSPGSTDGVGSKARFNNPRGLATDSLDNVYVADGSNSTIRKITPAGVVSTLAGAAGVPGFADGTGVWARFDRPSGVCVDSLGNVYVAEIGNHTIRRVTPDGTVSTVAGSAGEPGSADGVGAEARFRYPQSVTIDYRGNLYVGDYENYSVRKIDTEGRVTTLAGAWGATGSADGLGANAGFRAPAGAATDLLGNVYVADYGNGLVRQITMGAAVSTLMDSAGSIVRLSAPGGVAVDSVGNIYVTESWSNRVRKLSSSGTLTTLAGTGEIGSADGDGASATFAFCYWMTPHTRDCPPTGLAADDAGNVYVADAYNHTIRRITAAGVVSTMAGTAKSAGSADGIGAEARFNTPNGVSTDSAGNVYVADTRNHAIRKIAPTGAVSTLAGTAGSPGSADGLGAEARFNSPRSIATDGAGNLYVADTGNSTVRRITPEGSVTTIAGVAGVVGFMHGALPGVLASPQGIAISGNRLYVTLYNGLATVINLP